MKSYSSCRCLDTGSGTTIPVGTEAAAGDVDDDDEEEVEVEVEVEVEEEREEEEEEELEVLLEEADTVATMTGDDMAPGPTSSAAAKSPSRLEAETKQLGQKSQRQMPQC